MNEPSVWWQASSGLASNTWYAALARAGALIEAGLPPQPSWEATAERGILAVGFYALAQRVAMGEETAARPVREIDLSELLVALFERETYVQCVLDGLHRAGHATDAADGCAPNPADEPDPVAACWRWLTRTWPAPTDGKLVPRWGGLPRGRARGLHLPAVDVCLAGAANTVDNALLTERGALQHRRHVLVTDGDVAVTGQIDCGAWEQEQGRITEGPPAGYRVRLPDRGEQLIAAEHVQATEPGRTG